MGATHADKACAVAMLENIHSRWDVSAVDVKVMLRDGKAFVAVATNVKTKTILLPPCVLKTNWVHDNANEHPAAVQVSVTLAASKDRIVKDDNAHQKKVDVVLLPEFKAPTAVAAALGSAVGVRVVPQWIRLNESGSIAWTIRKVCTHSGGAQTHD